MKTISNEEIEKFKKERLEIIDLKKKGQLSIENELRALKMEIKEQTIVAALLVEQYETINKSSPELDEFWINKLGFDPFSQSE